MPKTVVTIRELKNKESGVDVYVPSYKEHHGLLTTTYTYNVLVVSNLSCFKTEEHKPTDVVQFVVSRPDEHFVRLRHFLLTKFPESDLPQLSKPSSLFGDVIPKERKLELENFLKKVVASKELIYYHLTLEFLGLPSMIAYNYCIGKTRQNSDNDDVKTSEKAPSQQGDPENEPEYGDLFTLSDDLQADDALFGATMSEESGLFSDTLSADSRSNRQARHSSSKLFQDQDFGGGVSRTDAPELFLATEGDVTETKVSTDLESEDFELLNIEDDIDNLLRLSEESPTKPKPTKKPNLTAKPVIARKPGSTQAKPTPKPKPSVKPKPTRNDEKVEQKMTPQKGLVFVEDDEISNENENIFESKKLDFEEKEGVSSSQDLFLDSSADANLNNYDILNYIQQNTSRTDDDLDLFS